MRTEKATIQKQWLTVRFTPKEYANLIGHSEQYVRKYCMPQKLRNDREALIEMRIPLTDILNGCDKLTTISSEERRAVHEQTGQH